jgi:hypothetical protein
MIHLIPQQHMKNKIKVSFRMSSDLYTAVEELQKVHNLKSFSQALELALTLFFTENKGILESKRKMIKKLADELQ